MKDNEPLMRHLKLHRRPGRLSNVVRNTVRPIRRMRGCIDFRIQRYDPDNYEHLAPEMKTLALAKMQEINAAYTLVKTDIGH
jgi:hypothetical protein